MEEGQEREMNAMKERNKGINLFSFVCSSAIL